MNLALLLPIAKQIALRAITHKLVDEPADELTVRSIKGEVAPVEFCKKKTMRMTSIYILVVTTVLTYLSSTGTIDPALYQLLSSILTSPEVIEMVPNYSEVD